MARPGRRHLKIGELERTLGVTRDQIHHYVEVGLVPAPEKSTATLAWYGPEHQRAILRVRAMRDAGASLAQAQRWLTGSLADLGPDDARTLAGWVLGGAGRPRVMPPLDAITSAMEARLAVVAPDALVSGPPVDAAAWLAEIAARWAECEEHARVRVAREAMTAAAEASLATWWSIDAARVEGGVLRAAVLDRQEPGVDATGDEERARLGVMLPSNAPAPAARVPGSGGWSSVARGMASMRARRWSSAAEALAGATARSPGAALARVIAWCNDAVAAARGGDGVLALVPRLEALRATDPVTVDDRIERLRLRWTLAETWMALPARWVTGQPAEQLDAVMEELASIPVGHPARATGELDVLEANALLSLCSQRMRAGDAKGAMATAERVLPFGGAAAVEAAKRGRRAARSV